jgi:hypothetical protein
VAIAPAVIAGDVVAAGAALSAPYQSRMARYSGSQVFCLIAIERKLRPANFVS